MSQKLPESGEVCNLDHVIMAVRNLKKSQLTSFVGANARSLIETVLGSVLLKIQNGDRVRPETLNIASPDWKAEALERCSHAFQRFFTDEKIGEQQLLAGKKAMYDAIFVPIARKGCVGRIRLRRRPQGHS